jgi:hypothetical protein
MGMGIAAGACRVGDGRGWRRRSGRSEDVKHSPSSATWPPAVGEGLVAGADARARGVFALLKVVFTWTALESLKFFLR